MDCCHTTAPLRDRLKDSNGGKSSNWTELKQCTELFIFYGDIQSIWTLIVVITSCSGTREEKNWEIGDKDIWGRCIFMEK